jgi:hypothetical protein
MESQMTTTTPKSNDAALAAFMAGKAEIDALLARIAAASDDHFGINPERVTWGDAGSLGLPGPKTPSRKRSIGMSRSRLSTS